MLLNILIKLIRNQVNNKNKNKKLNLKMKYFLCKVN